MKIIIRAYQTFISPLLMPRCRFYPTCSFYALECFEKHSFLVAFLMTIKRLLKCHPLNKGGIDLPS